MKIKLLLICLACYSLDSHAACSAEQKHPEGKPNNFKINAELKRFERAYRAIQNLAMPADGLALRAAIMTSMFAPHRRYDLKNNPNYMASQEFGNWFFGAAASQMGFSQQEALAAGAVVQQYQNYTYENHKDYGDLSQLASNIMHSASTGEGDNADDAAPIAGGHSYSENVYKKDPNAQEKSDSCEQTGASNSNENYGDGYGGGWGMDSSSGTVISGGCYGDCGTQGSNGILFGTIVDLPEEKDD